MGISTAVERREHFTDLQISSKKIPSNQKTLNKYLLKIPVWTSLLQTRDMTRLETGKEIQVLDWIAIDAQ